MKIEIIANSVRSGLTKEKLKDMFDDFSGKVAGVCYMPGSFNDLLNEDSAKTCRRVEMTMGSGHHSVFDHNFVSLYLEDIPKLFAMLLNNEKMYVTSEKSARYTKMNLSPKEKALFEKWQARFESLIKEKYPNGGKYIESRVTKLALENARYLISVMTPTTMVHTLSYRQLNYIYGWARDIVKKPAANKLYKLLKPAIAEFCEVLEKLGLLDDRLINNGKNRSFSLIEKNCIRQEYFGDVYSTNYQGSFAELGQAHRHRTIAYTMSLPEKPTFYVPEILKGDDKLVKEWNKDILSVADIFPQGMMININERGTLENFILKMKERCCTYAQLEINRQTVDTLNKYVEALSGEQKEMLKKYCKGSRCTFPDYKCESPCGFADGVIGKRKI